MSVRGAALIVAVVLVADRLTKMAVDSAMILGQSIPVVPNFVSLTYVRNRGAAFGILAESGWADTFLIVVALAAVAGLGWLFSQVPPDHRVERTAAAAVIGGALGNLYDRLADGAVIDFVDVYVGRWHWPAFNVADSCITVGVIVLVAASFLQRSPESENDDV